MRREVHRGYTRSKYLGNQQAGGSYLGQRRWEYFGRLLDIKRTCDSSPNDAITGYSSVKCTRIPIHQSDKSESHGLLSVNLPNS